MKTVHEIELFLRDLMGDHLNLHIRHRFYQIVWFQVVMTTAASGLVFLLVLMRLRISTELSEAQMREHLIEKERVARELHDTLLQGFQGVLLRIQAAARLVPLGEPARCALEAALDQADEVLIEGRNSIPYQRVGDSASMDLVRAFEKCIANLQLGKYITAQTEVLECPRHLQRLVQVAIYGIGREALTNAFRHSDATEISLKLSFGDAEFRMLCQDDGIGVAPEITAAGQLRGHLGLVGMREEARKIRAIFGIRRVDPHGTIIEIVIPARIAYIRRKRRSLLKILLMLMRRTSDLSPESALQCTSDQVIK